jgi:hypothetical protein
MLRMEVVDTAFDETSELVVAAAPLIHEHNAR